MLTHPPGIGADSLLNKHSTGEPLSIAERIQRQRAARARWDKARAAAAAGVAGAAIGAGAGVVRQAVDNSVRAEASARLQGIYTADRLRQSDARLAAETTRLKDALTAAIRRRMRANPETGKERQERFRQIMQNPMGARVRPPETPVIGTLANLRIYDYQVSQLQKTLLQETRHLERLVRRDPDDVDAPHIRRQRARVLAVQADIDRLQKLKAAGPRKIARRGGDRQTGKRQVEVAAAVERKHVGGETLKQIKRRISDEKSNLTARHQRLMRLIDRRAEKIRATRADRIIKEDAAAVRAAFEQGQYQSKILRAARRGGALGAVAGLSTIGLGILAHHVARAVHRRASVRKIDGAAELAKAAEPETPEQSIGTGLSAAYRRWIDRLLGRGSEPLALGDGFAEAAADGLTRAYAEGLRNPPVDRVRSDPRAFIDVDFDQINSATRRHMAEYALDKIVQLTDAQRESIRQILMDQAIMRGIGPPDVARKIREAIGLTTYQRGVVDNYRQGLKDLDPRVLDRKLRDARYDRTIQKAIAKNEPLSDEQINDMVDAYHRRMIAHRAVTIARTEALRATSYGGVARAQEVLDDHPELDVTKKWLATEDGRTRCTHRDLNGKEVDGMETPFVTTVGNPIRWPLDDTSVADEVINCRCTLRFIFKPRHAAAAVQGTPA